jgi:hypothetical protein
MHIVIHAGVNEGAMNIDTPLDDAHNAGVLFHAVTSKSLNIFAVVMAASFIVLCDARMRSRNEPAATRSDCVIPVILPAPSGGRTLRSVC